jgi:hypothetical protein
MASIAPSGFTESFVRESRSFASKSGLARAFWSILGMSKLFRSSSECAERYAEQSERAKSAQKSARNGLTGDVSENC